MFNRSICRAALVVALPAFMAGASAAPALASSSYDDEKKITVKVCKEVVKDDHDKSDKKDDKAKFTIKVRTDEKDKRVKLRDGECKEFDLKYDHDKKVYAKEYDIPDGYTFKKLACYDGYGTYYPSTSYGKACDVKKDYVKIVVVNVKEYHKKY